MKNKKKHSINNPLNPTGEKDKEITKIKRFIANFIARKK